jgi:hypothetical protein
MLRISYLEVVVQWPLEHSETSQDILLLACSWFEFRQTKLVSVFLVSPIGFSAKFHAHSRRMAPLCVDSE